MIIVQTGRGKPMTNADKFKQIFGLYATELWSKTEGEFLVWLNSDFNQSDVLDTNVGDIISRQAAIDEIKALYEWHEIVTEDRAIDHFKRLPSAQPRNGEWIDYSDEGYIECPFCHSATNCEGNKDELHYCFSCGAELR